MAFALLLPWWCEMQEGERIWCWNMLKRKKIKGEKETTDLSWRFSLECLFEKICRNHQIDQYDNVKQEEELRLSVSVCWQPHLSRTIPVISEDGEINTSRSSNAFACLSVEWKLIRFIRQGNVGCMHKEKFFWSRELVRKVCYEWTCLTYIWHAVWHVKLSWSQTSLATYCSYF